MIEALFEGLFLVLQWKPLIFMLGGIVLGFWVGLLPGLGGATTLALMLPFIYTMQPVEAFAFLLGMHAVVATTGDITSVLFGVPVVRPLVLSFGSPELFMLAIVGLAFIASLSSHGARGMLRGFLAGGLGLF